MDSFVSATDSVQQWHCSRCRESYSGDPASHLCMHTCVLCGDRHPIGIVCPPFIASLRSVINDQIEYDYESCLEHERTDCSHGDYKWQCLVKLGFRRYHQENGRLFYRREKEVPPVTFQELYPVAQAVARARGDA